MGGRHPRLLVSSRLISVVRAAYHPTACDIQGCKMGIQLAIPCIRNHYHCSNELALFLAIRRNSSNRRILLVVVDCSLVARVYKIRVLIKANLKSWAILPFVGHQVQVMRVNVQYSARAFIGHH